MLPSMFRNNCSLVGDVDRATKFHTLTGEPSDQPKNSIFRIMATCMPTGTPYNRTDA